jgi:dGTPase
MKGKARRLLIALFQGYLGNLRLLPEEFRERAERLGPERIIADYIAGMTDRYAIQEYERLFDPAVGA